MLPSPCDVLTLRRYTAVVVVVINIIRRRETRTRCSYSVNYVRLMYIWGERGPSKVKIYLGLCGVIEKRARDQISYLFSRIPCLCVVFIIAFCRHPQPPHEVSVSSPQPRRRLTIHISKSHLHLSTPFTRASIHLSKFRRFTPRRRSSAILPEIPQTRIPNVRHYFACTTVFSAPLRPG